MLLCFSQHFIFSCWTFPDNIKRASWAYICFIMAIIKIQVYDLRKGLYILNLPPMNIKLVIRQKLCRLPLWTSFCLIINLKSNLHMDNKVTFRNANEILSFLISGPSKRLSVRDYKVQRLVLTFPSCFPLPLRPVTLVSLLLFEYMSYASTWPLPLLFPLATMLFARIHTACSIISFRSLCKYHLLRKDFLDDIICIVTPPCLLLDTFLLNFLILWTLLLYILLGMYLFIFVCCHEM